MKEIKTINKKVKIDIHPDGDIYVWKNGKFRFIGTITDNIDIVQAENPVAEKFYKALSD